MLRNRRQKKSVQRKYAFAGTTFSDSIVIGNHGNAKLVAKGEFNLSGILFSLEGKIEFQVAGSGLITFSGKCRHLVISKLDGDCVLDFSEVKCNTVICNALSGSTTVLLGDVKRVNVVQMTGDATLKINSDPLITAHSVGENARILCARQRIPSVAIHPQAVVWPTDYPLAD